MLGKTISHYRIFEKLGEGGMGVVYKAEDTKLKRVVALKFLPPELTRDADAKARFLREAQAAAALHHPDICTIYEIDEVDSQAFISMAYVDGERLKDKVERGPLKLEEALDIAVHVAQGLAAAHEKGVTLSLMRRYAEAEPYFDRAILLRPDEAYSFLYKGWMHVVWRGDTKEAREVLEEGARKGDADLFTDYLVTLDLVQGDYQRALDRLPVSGAYVDFIGVNDLPAYFLTKSRIYGLLNEQHLREAFSDSARIVLEEALKSRPGDATIHSRLGTAYAGLGRRKDAIREGRKAVELLPVSKDALEGPDRVRNLAQIYVMVGDYDDAVDLLEYLLSVPAAAETQISVPLLRIDPTWAPLRSNPRFQKLLVQREKTRP